MSAPLLAISDLSCSYGAGDVVRGLSLDMLFGQVIGLVGPNGHGKTTLLRAISGLMPQQSGSVAFEGSSLSGLRPDEIARRGLVHVPQGDLVYKQMTIRENLLVGAWSNRTKAETERQLEQVHDLFPKLLDRRLQLASSLSGGERRMLGIGRGLMMAQAKLIMLDEPSLGLAPVVIDEIYRAIVALKETGLSVIVVEENVTRAASVASDLYLMDRGSIVWSGAAKDLAGSRDLLATYLGA